jgi:hypothetical protein
MRTKAASDWVSAVHAKLKVLRKPLPQKICRHQGGADINNESPLLHATVGSNPTRLNIALLHTGFCVGKEKEKTGTCIWVIRSLRFTLIELAGVESVDDSLGIGLAIANLPFTIAPLPLSLRPPPPPTHCFACDCGCYNLLRSCILAPVARYA